MPFGLIIGTDRAQALERSIQNELAARGYSPDGDNVMAEYITIMIINNKTAGQINSELEDLIGSEFDHAFTDWLFAEAAKGLVEEVPPQAPEPAPERIHEAPPRGADSSRRSLTTGGRNGLYQQALSQAVPSTSQKRSASARSLSPSHPNKARRTDVPTGPRAMQREGPPNTRSLIDRVSSQPRNGSGNNFHDDIQSRIDNITGAPDANMMMANGFPGMSGIDMNQLAAMGGPQISLQDLLMNQMALMQQVLSPQMAGMYGMQSGMPMDMGMMNGQFPGQQGFPPQQGANVGRGRGRGRGGARGRGGHHSSGNASTPETVPPAVAPAPVQATPQQPTPAVTSEQQRPAYALLERPQSPTLCKYATKCVNPQCRWAHPSPVATAESGMVLSTEPCEQGKDCKDKDCPKTHVSRAVLTANTNAPPPPSAPPTHASRPPTSHIPCRFGAACTRPGCTFSHPPRQGAGNAQRSEICRYAAGCTKATCPFQHPEGRVLPTSFHRGLSTTAPMVNLQAPETGSMGPSHHKSVKFNNAATMKEKLEKLEQDKNAAENDLKKRKEEAASKDSSKPQVAITA